MILRPCAETAFVLSELLSHYKAPFVVFYLSLQGYNDSGYSLISVAKISHATFELRSRQLAEIWISLKWWSTYRQRLCGAVNLPYCLLMQVLINGQVVGNLERNVPQNLSLSLPSLEGGHQDVQLDIVLHALGRVNFGCIWDLKGLVHGRVLLNGKFPFILNEPVS